MDDASAAVSRGTERLSALSPGMPIVYGGDKVARVTPELATRFRDGDRLLVVQESGDLLLIPQAVQAIAHDIAGWTLQSGAAAEARRR